MTVRWENYIWDESRPTEPLEVKRLEQAWGVDLPDLYKILAAKYQGMTPVPNCFTAGALSDSVAVLLTISIDPEKEDYSVLDSFNTIKPHVPDGIYPFALTPGGEFVCFDYRDSPTSPRIALVTVEMSILPLTDSLEGFLQGLHDL